MPPPTRAFGPHGTAPSEPQTRSSGSTGGRVNWATAGSIGRFGIQPASTPQPAATTPPPPKPSFLQNFLNPIIGAAKGMGEGIVHTAGTPIEAARIGTAALTGNQKAEQAAKVRFGTDTTAAMGMLQAAPRTIAQTGISLAQNPLNLSPEKHLLGANNVYQPKGAAQLLFGKDPIQSFANAYEAGKQQGGVAGGLGNEVANVAGGLLSVAGLRGGIKSGAKAVDNAKTAATPVGDATNANLLRTIAKPPKPAQSVAEAKTAGSEPQVNEARTTGSQTTEPQPVTDQTKANLSPEYMAPTSKNPIAQNLRQIFAPATTSQAARDTAMALREYKARIASTAALEADRGHKAFKVFDGMATDAQRAEVSAYERTGVFPTIEAQLPGYSKMYRESTDAAHKALQEVHQDKPLGYIQNYVQRHWVFENLDQQNAAIQALYGMARTLRPSSRNLKQRKLDIPLDEAQKILDEKGIKAVQAITNPETLRQSVVTQAEAARAWKEFGDRQAASGLRQFVKFGKQAPVGFRTVSDPAFQVMYPGEVTFHEAYDAQVMAGLRKVIRDLGITHKRELSLTGNGARRMGKDTAGVSFLPTGKYFEHREAVRAAKAAGEEPPKRGPAGEIHTKFGTPETVLTHELGHQMDTIYGLKGQLISRTKPVKTIGLDGKERIEYTGPNGQTMKELLDLAKQRGFHPQDPYPKEPGELIANLLHAYVHAPELLDSVAPTAKARLDGIIDRNPELQQLRDIKPSLMLSSNEMSKYIGMVHGGQYMFPEDSARVIDNAVSKGLGGHALFRGARNVKNGINAANLLSYFHAGMTTMTSQWEDLAFGLRKEITGVRTGNTKDILSGMKHITRSTVPTASMISNAIRASKAMKELRKTSPLASSEIKSVLDRGGFRLKEGQDMRVAMKGTVRNALANGDWLKAAERLPAAAVQKAMSPIMDYMVPMAKLGAYLDRAKFEMEHHTGTDAELAVKLAKASDSMDNIFGQLAYDNLFWNNTFKDVVMLTQRSLGWNAGSMRELGGGLLDARTILTKRQISDRTLRALTLPVIVGIYGALYQLFRTGQAPQQMIDYLYPKTGGTTPNGDPERSQLPSYMKDVVSAFKSPSHYALSKLSPLFSIPSDIIANQDYYGNMIRNKTDSNAQQLEQIGAYVAKSMLPFAVTNFLQNTQHNPETVAENSIGITPAPASATRTPFANRVLSLYSMQLDRGPQTPEAAQVTADKQKAREQIIKGQGHSFLDQMVSKGEITQTSADNFLAQSKETSTQRAWDNLNQVNRWKLLQNASPQDLAQIEDIKSIEVQAASVLNNKQATPADKQAAQNIINHFGGDTGSLETQAKQAKSAKTRATRLAHKK